MDNKGLRVGIISGVVSSLVVIIFIQPILSFIWKAFMAIVGSVHQGYVDRIYRNAAVGERNLSGQLTFAILLLLVVTALLVYSIRKLAALPPFQSTFAWASPVLKLVLAGAGTGAALSFCVILLIAFSLSSGVMEISASFTQRLTVLAPAISDTEYKALRARWASMQGKADYDALVAAMDKRAAELRVTLPAVREP